MHDPELEDVTTSMSWLRDRGGRWIAVLLSLLLIVPLGSWVVTELSFRAAGDAVEEAEPELADAVLLVSNLSCDGRASTGSGFATTLDGVPVVLTNRHVVDGAARVGLRTLDGDPGPTVEQVLVSTFDDVAALVLSEPADGGLSLATGPQRGDEVRLVGFPGARPITSSGTVDDIDGARVLMSMRVDGGASGAPVVNEDGEVVAQVVARTGEGLGVAIGADRVSAALDALAPLPDC